MSKITKILSNVDNRGEIYRNLGLIATTVGFSEQAKYDKKLSNACTFFGCAFSALSFVNHLNYLSRTEDEDGDVFMSVIKTELLSPLIDIAIFKVSASKDRSSKTLIFSNTGIHEA